MTEGKTFDPGRYLTKVGSSDYLEVKWRLVWLREVHPEALIDTNLVAHSDQMAIFKASVVIPGGGQATGYGSEGYDDFRDYIEKAETKAIGRALAALGFGTQFCPDFDFGSSHGAVVDSPIDFANTRGRRLANTLPNGNNGGPGQPATPRQLKFIQAIAREHGIGDDEINAEAEQLYGRQVSQLDRRDASAFIERLQSRRIDTADPDDPDDDGLVSWGAFWKHANAAGYTTKPDLEKAMGQALGVDPAFALERFLAWRKDMAEQTVLA